MEMMFYGVEPSFWLKLLLLLVIIWLLLFSFNTIMRSLLKVEKTKMFSHNHVNFLHKKIDWTLRIIFIVAIIVGSIINILRDPLDSILFLEPYFIAFSLIYVTEIVRAVMEWMYAKNRNAPVFTITQLMFLTVLLLSLYYTNFFGFFG